MFQIHSDEFFVDPVHFISPSSRRKLVRRVEDLVRLSSALRPTLLPALRSLVDNVSNAVDFAIQLAQRIGGYSADIRASKEPLRLDTILGFLQEITADARQGTDLAPWDVVAGFVARLGQEAAVILPTMMEQEHVFKGKFGTIHLRVASV